MALRARIAAGVLTCACACAGACAPRPREAKVATAPARASGARPISFQWRGGQLETDATVTGSWGLADDAPIGKLVLRDLPAGAIVRGGLFEEGREPTWSLYSVELFQVLGETPVDALSAPIDLRTTVSIELPDGRAGTTALPPILVYESTVAAFLAASEAAFTFGTEADDPEPQDSMLYVERGMLAVYGRRGRFAQVDLVAVAMPIVEANARCEYEIAVAHGSGPREMVTVNLRATELSIRDRRTGVVVARQRWPAPTGCPDDVWWLEDQRVESALPYDEIRAWLDAWFSAWSRPVSR